MSVNTNDRVKSSLPQKDQTSILQLMGFSFTKTYAHLVNFRTASNDGFVYGAAWSCTRLFRRNSLKEVNTPRREKQFPASKELSTKNNSPLDVTKLLNPFNYLNYFSKISISYIAKMVNYVEPKVSGAGKATKSSLFFRFIKGALMLPFAILDCITTPFVYFGEIPLVKPSIKSAQQAAAKKSWLSRLTDFAYGKFGAAKTTAVKPTLTVDLKTENKAHKYVSYKKLKSQVKEDVVDSVPQLKVVSPVSMFVKSMVDEFGAKSEPEITPTLRHKTA